MVVMAEFNNLLRLCGIPLGSLWDYVSEKPSPR